MASVHRVGGVLQAQRRWRRESGPEVARRRIKERLARANVKYHGLSDAEIRELLSQWEGTPFLSRRKSLRLADFADEHGGVDFFEYADYKFKELRNQAGRLHKEDVFWEQAQHANPDNIRKRFQMERAESASRGKYSRWRGQFAGLEGVRVVGSRERLLEEIKKNRDNFKFVEETVKVTLPNPYVTLGLNEKSNAKDASLAYRKLAKVHHPDAQGGSAAKMTEINEAYRLVKQIIREGGPAKSGTASECAQAEVVHKYRVRKEAAQRAKSEGSVDEMLFVRSKQEMQAILELRKDRLLGLTCSERRKLLTAEAAEDRELAPPPLTFNQLQSRALIFRYVPPLFLFLMLVFSLTPNYSAGVAFYSPDPYRCQRVTHQDRGEQILYTRYTATEGPQPLGS